MRSGGRCTTAVQKGPLSAAGRAPRPRTSPARPEAGYLTNETVFSLTELPPRLAVIGGGPIGYELAQPFSTFRQSGHAGGIRRPYPRA
ncbi:MAG: hypothetical protein MZV70_17110 [Desulfobacterales bacterium]|nr:hypothetical protein [Desulfobacterales bacterium]